MTSPSRGNERLRPETSIRKRRYAASRVEGEAVTCAELVEIITDYLEGGMPFWERRRFELHLAICPACRRYIQQMKQTVEALGELPSEPIPADVERALLERFRGWKRSSSGRRAL
jgi:anti-sigma factor RsiW